MGIGLGIWMGEAGYMVYGYAVGARSFLRFAAGIVGDQEGAFPLQGTIRAPVQYSLEIAASSGGHHAESQHTLNIVE